MSWKVSLMYHTSDMNSRFYVWGMVLTYCILCIRGHNVYIALNIFLIHSHGYMLLVWYEAFTIKHYTINKLKHFFINYQRVCLDSDAIIRHIFSDKRTLLGGRQEPRRQKNPSNRRQKSSNKILGVLSMKIEKISMRCTISRMCIEWWGLFQP